MTVIVMMIVTMMTTTTVMLITRMWMMYSQLSHYNFSNIQIMPITINNRKTRKSS